MKSVIILLLGVAAVSSFKLAEPELVGMDIVVPPIEPSDRIIGGTAIPITDAPWQIGLAIGSNGWCGGSLIAPNWVVTAAHCVDSSDASNLVVYLGSAERAKGTKRIPLKKIVHSGWNSNTVLNDIALLQIEPVSESNSIRAAKLASKSYTVPAGTELTATGWGKTSDGIFASVVSKLQSADMLSITNELCAKTFGSYIQPSNICVSTAAGTSTCNGDSGGPLVKGDLLIGVTSFGSSAGCTKGAPSAFTRISSYNEWIREKTGLNL